MPNSEFYRRLIQNVIDAHAEHRRIWQEEKQKTGNNTSAYAASKDARKNLHRQLELLYEKGLDPIDKPFRAGETSAIDEIITFLEVDLPAFRVGYEREKYLRKLKRKNLSEKQIERLRTIALKRCANSEFRREDSELQRLMIGLADESFVQSIEAIPARKGSMVEKHKLRMLQAVFQGRKDLRYQLKSMQGSKT